MSGTTTAPIPVYISRYTAPLPDGYGAFIEWKAGERCRVLSRSGRPTANGTVLDGTMKWHKDAPVVDSARGKGQWVYEVSIDGESGAFAISPGQLLLPDSSRATP